MFPEQLKKILNLVKKTGDRVVVFDANAPDDSYVIMGFDNYAAGFDSDCDSDCDCDCDCDCASDQASCCEKPVSAVPDEKIINNREVSANTSVKAEKSANTEEKENLTEEDLTDKINREILMWKNQENSAYLGEENKPKKAWAIPPRVKDKAQEIE